MRKTAITLLALGLVAMMAASAYASNVVRISQVYGGGGNTGAPYLYDYVELFNSGPVPVDISGWSLQYGSATGTSNLGACTNCLCVLPQGASIPACGYYLVQLAPGTTVTNVPLPVPADYVMPAATATNLSGTSGKIGLYAGSATQPCIPLNAFVDLVGYGTANCYEGAARAGTLSNSSMAVRNGGGMVDTDQNGSDFTVVTNAVPRNSQSLLNADCLAVPAKPATWGSVKVMYR